MFFLGGGGGGAVVADTPLHWCLAAWHAVVWKTKMTTASTPSSKRSASVWVKIVSVIEPGKKNSSFISLLAQLWSSSFASFSCFNTNQCFFCLLSSLPLCAFMKWSMSRNEKDCGRGSGIEFSSNRAWKGPIYKLDSALFGEICHDMAAEWGKYSRLNWRLIDKWRETKLKSTLFLWHLFSFIACHINSSDILGTPLWQSYFVIYLPLKQNPKFLVNLKRRGWPLMLFLFIYFIITTTFALNYSGKKTRSLASMPSV